MFNIFKSNYVRIAENTTKYYLELNNNYRERFKDKTSLIAAAGILDAQNYVFADKPLLGVQDIIQASREIKKSESKLKHLTNIVDNKYALLLFITWLEHRIFVVDNPKIPVPYIFEAVEKKGDLIEKTVYKTLEKYRGDSLLKQATVTFMESPQFEPIRKKLGVKG